MGASLPPGVGRWAIDIGLPPQPSPSWCKGGCGGLGSLRTTDSRRVWEPRCPLSLRDHSLPLSEKELFLHNCVPLGFCVLKQAFWKHGSRGSSWRGPCGLWPGPRASPSPPTPTPGLATEGGLRSTHSHEPTQPPPLALPGKGPGVSQRRRSKQAVGVPLSSHLEHTDPKLTC